MNKIDNPEKLSNREWIRISRSEVVTPEFMREYKEYLDWETVCIYQKLDEQTIEEFLNYVDWGAVSSHQILSEDFIRRYINNVNWSGISAAQKLSLDFIRENIDKLSFQMLCYNDNINFSLDFLREFEDIFDWNAYWNFKAIKINILTEFKNTITNWKSFSTIRHLSEEIIDKFKNELSWKEICMCSKMSEYFLESHLDYIDWDALCYSQILSEWFIHRHQDKVNWKYIKNSEYYKFSDHFKKIFSSKLGM